ncbi:MAG: hypothetical protein FJ146_07200 [Deltaproteobacteria bacterium]|nr:hypothetical protein [Deltaproteobacteria bacterium]
MSELTSQNAQPPKSHRTMSWLTVLCVVAGAFACGGRIGKIDFPVGVTVVVYPVKADAVRPMDETYPHATLQLSVGGRNLSFDEDFELVLLGPGADGTAVARYKSTDLAAAVKDTRCGAGTATLATDVRAVFCGASLPLDKATIFLLVRPDGSTAMASSPSGDERDEDLGIRHLALSF